MSADSFFEQLFDESSSTLTYIVGDAATREALIVDSVDHQIERDLGVLASHGLRLIFTLETTRMPTTLQLRANCAPVPRLRRLSVRHWPGRRARGGQRHPRGK